MSSLKSRLTTSLLQLLCAALLSAIGAPLNADTDQEYAVRAGLTSNLARFTTWPATPGSTLNLCLVGNPAIEEPFTALNGKAVGEKILQVRYLSRFNGLNECQLLYINELDKNRLVLLLNEIKLLPILTIGEDIEFVKNGGMVSLELVTGKVNITVNLTAAKQSKLNISARVLKLAKVLQ